MSSSMSADYSPTSNYSYSSDLYVPATSPERHSQPRPDSNPPPRLSSPHIFRNIFAESVGPTTRSPPRLPPLHEINFNETMQDVNRALQSANRAIQTAQEAFQSRRTSSANMDRRQDFVDLTGSPPLHPRNARSTDQFVVPDHSTWWNGAHVRNEGPHQSFQRRAGPSVATQPLFVEEDDPTSRYMGQSDSLAGPQRRFEAQGHNQRRLRVTFPNIPNMERTLLRSGLPDARRHEEEEAIRRQRVAREQWEQTQQRQRLQQSRDRIIASTQNQQNRARGQPSSSQHSQQSASIPSSSVAQRSGVQVDRLQSSSPDSGASPVESIDLTSVNDRTDLAAALIHAQSTNPTADPTTSSTQPRSALTAYKCPICLEPPRNATSTICGHLFCHECILETLKNSENMRREDAPVTRKVKGQCPVCRKELARKEEEGIGRTLVPLEIKLISKAKMEELRRKERKRQRELEKKEKGKGKEKIDGRQNQKQQLSGEEVFELSSDDEEGGCGAGGSSQKENKAKRLKLDLTDDFDEDLFGAFINDEIARD